MKNKNETLSVLLVILLVCEQLQSPLMNNLDLSEDNFILDDTLIYSTDSNLDTLLGQSGTYIDASFKIVRWRNNTSWISSKLRNKKIKSDNGNRNTLSTLRIIHWNGGAKKVAQQKIGN